MVVEKPILGLSGYFARDDGTIRTPLGNILRGSPTKHGHLVMGINTRVYCVHRLIAHTFIFNPLPNVFKVVDHINNDPSDNRPSNLRWITQQRESMLEVRP